MLLFLACVWTPGAGCFQSNGSVTVAPPQLRDSGSCPLAILVDSSPQRGQQNFFYRDHPWVEVEDGVDVELTVMTRDASREISGTTKVEGDRVYFMQSEELSASTEYILQVTSCFASEGIPFSTGVFGQPVEDLGVLSGKRYRIGRVTEGDLQDLLWGELVPELGFVVQESQVVVAPLQQGTQNLCEQSLRQDANFEENPYFYASLGDLSWENDAGIQVAVHDVGLHAVFLPNGSAFWGRMVGYLDGRDDGWAAVGGLCTFVSDFNMACSRCEDGVPVCVMLDVDNLATSVDMGDIVEVIGRDCPGCEVGEPVCE